MTKVISILAAGALTLSLSSVAFAADEQTQDPTGTTMMPDQGASPAELSKQDQEYLVALKKCESMQDAEKQKCVEQAKQKYKRM
jgi:hypothetical protein